MDFRTPCKTDNCNGRILLVTAQETGGFCMPCFKERKRKEEEEHIQQNRKIVNVYIGLTSPIDIIKAFHERRLYDPLICYETYPNLISQQYQMLDRSEAAKLVEFTIKLYKENKEEEAKKIASCLLAFTNTDIMSFLGEMIEAEDYSPPYLFKSSSSGIKKHLLEKYLKNEDRDGDLFKSIIWLAEENPGLDGSNDDVRRVVSTHRMTALTIKEGAQATRKEGFKKTILGNINVSTKGERWPMCDNVPLNPVIQLAISDLPYIPKELEGIKYLCVYIHPDDPAALLEKDDGLVIRTYTNEDLAFIEAPDSINQESKPILIEFEKVNDYPCNYQYPSIESYLSYGDTDDYLSKNKAPYNWKADFSKNSEGNPWEVNDCKILGWPNWIQWPEEPEDSTLILQVNNHGLWEYGDTSTLYIFRNNVTKEFSGFIQMF